MDKAVVHQQPKVCWSGFIPAVDVHTRQILHFGDIELRAACVRWIARVTMQLDASNRNELVPMQQVNAAGQSGP